jgi:RHS repeat-associated protein
LLATESGAGTYQYHHPDRLGTRLISDSGGSIISEQIHLPYGTALTGESVSYGSSANPSKKRFTSYERSDSTKLDHAVNRQYHSGLGRFTQVDPIGMGGVYITNPQYLNLYAYCLNDPINYVDPFGLFLGPETGGALGGPVVVIIVAVIGALRLIFGGRRRRTRMGMRVERRLAPVETGSTSDWIEPEILSGIGPVNAFIQTQSGKQRKCGEAIANTARANVGEKVWRTDRKRTTKDGKITSPSGAYKCNLFVYEVLKAAGKQVSGIAAPTSGGKGKWPAQAGD